MILYVNGDSHSVGHGITVDNYGMVKNDPEYAHIGEAPHPNSFPFSYGSVLSQSLPADLVCQGLSGGSWDRVIRLTKQFVYQSRGNIFVLLGLPDSQREEWLHNGVYYQINAIGAENLPLELQTKYKQWVIAKDEHIWYRRSVYMHDTATKLHHWLKQHNVMHLFFCFSQCLNMARAQLSEVTDFGANFFHPYDQDFIYEVWCKKQGFKKDVNGHYGADAHAAWATLLEPYIRKVISDSIR